MSAPKRKAAWRADTPPNGWTDDLIWYAAAINQMKQPAVSPDFEEALGLLVELHTGQMNNAQYRRYLEIVASWADPRGLGYQSQVHDTLLDEGSWPQVGGTKALWRACAHNNWFFLPWHRAFLLEFEAVCLAHITALGGPADWRLPYWNSSDYAKRPEAAGLPLPLTTPELPADVTVPGVVAAGGVARNPLYDPTRAFAPAPTPSRPTAGFFADASDALVRRHFATKEDKTLASFGGGYLEDEARFHNPENEDRESGQVDDAPHSSVHGEVGGNMGAFPTAGLDPVFWMHHANIDRLWETYAKEDYDARSPHGYPFPDGTPPSTEQTRWATWPFTFLRPSTGPTVWTAPQMLSTVDRGYEYDTTEAPDLAPIAPGREGEEDGPFGLTESDPNPIAEAEAIRLDGEVDTVLGNEDGGDGSAFAGTPGPWGLWIDGITAQRPVPTSFAVYLGLPPGTPGDDRDRDHFVGLLTLFGVYENSTDEGISSGSGSSRSFDVTHQVQALQPGFDPFHAPLRFVPTNDHPLGPAAIEIATVKLVVG